MTIFFFQMDGFSLVGGLGSLIVAGFCYSAYRNMQDVASHLRVSYFYM